MARLGVRVLSVPLCYNGKVEDCPVKQLKEGRSQTK